MAATLLLAPARSSAFVEPVPEQAAHEVAVDPIEFEATMTEPDRDTLGDRFSGSLQRAGFVDDPRASRNVHARVVKDRDDYRITVTLEGGTEPIELQETCELCGIGELGDVMEAMAGQLRRRVDLASAPAVVHVDSVPTGAEVSLDGEPVGTTPVDVSVEPGRHEIAVAKRGYRREARTFEAEPGSRASFSMELGGGGVRKWLPWTLIAVGVAGVAAGGTLIGIDGQEIRRDCNADIEGNCQYLHKTLGGGVALTAMGAGLLIGGVVLAVIWRRSDVGPQARRRVWPTGLGIAGRF